MRPFSRTAFAGVAVFAAGVAALWLGSPARHVVDPAQPLVPFNGRYRPRGVWPMAFQAGFLPAQQSRGADGIIVVYEGSPPAWVHNPATIAKDGLSGYSAHDMARALRDGDWLLEHQRPDGTWRYSFAFEEQAPGWSSALTQGEAISLLTRLSAATGEGRYLRAAVRAVAPIDRPTSRGGLRDAVRGHPFYEEYPAPPTHTLNGFLLCLVGLYDLSRAVPRSAAGRLYEQGRATLDAVLPLYDTPRGPRYDLHHHTGVDPGYTPRVVRELRTLESIGHSPVVERYANRWAQPYE